MNISSISILKNLLLQQGKEFLIVLKSGFAYKTSNPKITDDFVVFNDLRNKEVLVKLSEISKVEVINK